MKERRAGKYKGPIEPRTRRAAPAARRLVLGTCASLGLAAATWAAPVKLVDQAPVAVREVAPGVVLVDFGRVAFGSVRLSPPAGAAGKVAVHFGEALAGGRIDRRPPGSVRYGRAEVELEGGQPLVVAPPADERNTEHPSAVRTPAEWGVVLPFRWAEVEGWPGVLRPESIVRRAALAATWDDDAADLNQLGHYASDPDVRMARDTFDRLMQLPTWPTEWASHMVFMAHADWMQTGDRAWLAARYESLKPKLLLERARPGGLVASTAAQIERGGLVPPERRRAIVEWVVGRGMACSVYAAQYLLEALFEHGAGARALELISAPTDRSWRHVLDSGTTITWEAWDQKYKPNQDWNHAWGAAPANLLPRYVLGARALAPGWTRALVQPHPGALTRAEGKIPTPRGPVVLRWEKRDRFLLHLGLPPGTTAQVRLLAAEGTTAVWFDGRPAPAIREGAWWTLAKDVGGSVQLEVR